ncbi:glycosyltransferase family 4 protein [Seonamhaeicola maritimus]|uniref:glycosyltransferase family 4 protein n=1 Tax=Seonamhaeicola maritimus TaxID=2591822 RepID=UPI002494ECC8|nr:glycosyltransferase family 4 protein [Seonamhaeicola maritimus]
MTKAYKIAIYSGVVPSTTFIDRLIEGLAHKGQLVFTFGQQREKPNKVKNVFYITYTNWVSKLFFLLKYSLLLSLFKSKEKRKLKAIIRGAKVNQIRLKVKYYPVLYHSPDIFHLQWAKGITDWLWVKEFGMSLVLSLRGAHINYSPIADGDLAAIYRRTFPEIDGFHAVSEAIAVEAKKYGAPAAKLRVVYSGLNLDSFQNLPKRVKQERLSVVSVGRSHWKKGYHYALDACKLLKDKGVLFEYHIVGVGADIELLYQIEDLALGAEVHLHSSQTFDQVKALIHNTDVLLLPSVEEGIANVVLEAMALKTLVVSTNCGGMEEVLTDGENGFIVPIRDSRAIAEALLSVQCMSESEYHQITDNAQKTIAQQHTSKQMNSGMLDLYEFTGFKLHRI